MKGSELVAHQHPPRSTVVSRTCGANVMAARFGELENFEAPPREPHKIFYEMQLKVFLTLRCSTITTIINRNSTQRALHPRSDKTASTPCPLSKSTTNSTTGRCNGFRFRATLNSCRLAALSEYEVGLFQKLYAHPRDPRFIDYRRFCSDLEQPGIPHHLVPVDPDAAGLTHPSQPV